MPILRGLPPTLIIALPLFSFLILVSETIVGAFLGISLTVWISLLLFASKPIDEHIEENLSGMKRVPSHYFEPREWLRQATLFWLFAWLLFALQLLLQSQDYPPAIPYPENIIFDLGFLPLALGIFRTYHVGEFIRNRTYHPRIGILNGIIAAFLMFLVGGYGISLYLLTPLVFQLPIQGKAFYFVFIVSIIDASIFLKFILDGKEHSRSVGRLIFYLMPLPIYYVIGAVLYFLLVPLL